MSYVTFGAVTGNSMVGAKELAERRASGSEQNAAQALSPSIDALAPDALAKVNFTDPVGRILAQIHTSNPREQQSYAAVVNGLETVSVSVPGSMPSVEQLLLLSKIADAQTLQLSPNEPIAVITAEGRRSDSAPQGRMLVMAGAELAA